ncbi:MAG TPA: integration host factor subunit beta [Candidatus Thiothrix moscowensis]|uniref:integration host factor subunit beta n=1 Tax=unclassified Thiothrix TaxID=2636184 RepID=UPI001A2A4570|nr:MULTISPECIES: integration host factor subunit beta [unclassified Thiothrix]MBJ6610192.1 integration host factor subunit beta [Candidatus Thiothrix moscowensis]HRJ53557.1 integration host factor subunit beta [Candidatus Thiothrix moscowensis]HRJ93635.1 integration host factor subunit beta [Candidatus Thiothrix moscowensis]
MTKSEIIDILSRKQSHLSGRDVETSVKLLLDKMSETLAGGGRIEVRGFGSFSLHHRSARNGRNPKTGDQVELPPKHVPHFKPGKELRERVNESRAQYPVQD